MNVSASATAAGLAGLAGGIPAANSNPEPGNFRDRSPIRRREFDMRGRGELDMPLRGREPELLIRGGGGGGGGPPHHREMDRGPHDFDGRDQHPHEWGRDQRLVDMMDPFGGDHPYLDRERDLHLRDPFHSPLGDHRSNFR